MIHEEHPTVSLHNVAETTEAEWADDGARLRRVPRSVTENVNVGARERFAHPSGCELRFVPDSGESISVTLSARRETAVRPFWGAFQGEEVHAIGPGTRTLDLSVPARIEALDPEVAAGAFDPRVCRLRFEAWEPVAVHGVAGACRPPRAAERPDRRYLAYGTSITEGAAATALQHTYVARVARRLGFDPLNVGVSGSAYCEPALADYVASREDWDVATLSLSVNMANRGFTRDQFRDRVRSFVHTVARASDRPVVCVTLFPYHADLVRDGESERAAAFRRALREAVDDAPGSHVHLVEGPDLMSATGLTTDLLHPGDAGMEAIGHGLADALDGLD